MQPSLFAPQGLALLKAGKPLAEQLHATILQLFARLPKEQGAYNTEEGSMVDLFSFALAIVLARAIVSGQRVDGERFADEAYFFLREAEREHGITPDGDASVWTRRDDLADAKRAPRGNMRTELEQQLRDHLGDDYAGMHVMSDADGEVTTWPEDLGDQPQLLVSPTVDRKLVRILTTISTGLGSPQTVTYVTRDPLGTDDDPHTLRAGDKLVVEPEILHRAEVVDVTAVGTSGSSLTFTATFNEPHEPSAWATQMSFPVWTSTQRALIVALTAEAGVDPVARARANAKLAKILTGVTTWAVCPLSSATTVGPFTVGDPLLGAVGFNPIGTISIP